MQKWLIYVGLLFSIVSLAQTENQASVEHGLEDTKIDQSAFQHTS